MKVIGGPIRVVWQCDKFEDCINKERPGVHAEYGEMRACSEGRPYVDPYAAGKVFGLPERLKRNEEQS